MKRVLFEFSEDFGSITKGTVKKLDKPMAVALSERGAGFFVGDEPPTKTKPLEKKAVNPVKKKK